VSRGQFRSMTREELLASFWARVDKTPTCWLWTGGTGSAGYGLARDPRGGRGPDGGRPKISAHRIAYELVVGPIPDGLTLDHLCRVPPCVNPAHLEPVTQFVNNHRGNGYYAKNARKTHCPQGHPYDAANTRVNARGWRTCKTCIGATRRRFRERWGNWHRKPVV
jgi:hypothetical protein